MIYSLPLIEAEGITHYFIIQYMYTWGALTAASILLFYKSMLCLSLN